MGGGVLWLWPLLRGHVRVILGHAFEGSEEEEVLHTELHSCCCCCCGQEARAKCSEWRECCIV